MRDRLRTLLPSVLALSLVTLLTIPAVTAAQSGLPATVSMHPESAGPGAVVELTGLDFPGNSTVSLQLATSDGSVSLGTVATSGEGVFREVVALPAGAAAGTWELHARAADGTTAAYAFDPSAPAVVVDSSATTTAAAEAVGNSMGDIIFMLIIASVLGVIVTGVLFAYRLIQDERPQPGMGKADDLIWSGATKPTVREPTVTSEPFWKAQPAEPEPPVTEVDPSTEQKASASA